MFFGMTPHEIYTEMFRQWMNSKTPYLSLRVGKGIGDLLTSEVSCRSVLGLAGAMTPTAAVYGIGYAISGSHFIGAYGALLSLLSAHSTMRVHYSLGYAGYTVGERIDTLRGDKSPRDELFDKIVRELGSEKK